MEDFICCHLSLLSKKGNSQDLKRINFVKREENEPRQNWVVKVKVNVSFNLIYRYEM